MSRRISICAIAVLIGGIVFAARCVYVQKFTYRVNEELGLGLLRNLLLAQKRSGRTKDGYPPLTFSELASEKYGSIYDSESIVDGQEMVYKGNRLYYTIIADVRNNKKSAWVLFAVPKTRNEHTQNSYHAFLVHPDGSAFQSKSAVEFTSASEWGYERSLTDEWKKIPDLSLPDE